MIFVLKKNLLNDEIPVWHLYEHSADQILVITHLLSQYSSDSKIQTICTICTNTNVPIPKEGGPSVYQKCPKISFSLKGESKVIWQSIRMNHDNLIHTFLSSESS